MTENKRYEKRMNFNVSLPDERCFKNEYCIVDEARDRYEALSINEIVDRLNEQEERIQELETDNFSFTFTEDYERINNNTLEVLDKHTTIQMNGDRIHIVVIPPKSKPYSFKYYITGITFEYDEINSGDV